MSDFNDRRNGTGMFRWRKTCLLFSFLCIIIFLDVGWGRNPGVSSTCRKSGEIQVDLGEKRFSLFCVFVLREGGFFFLESQRQDDHCAFLPPVRGRKKINFVWGALKKKRTAVLFFFFFFWSYRRFPSLCFVEDVSSSPVDRTNIFGPTFPPSLCVRSKTADRVSYQCFPSFDTILIADLNTRRCNNVFSCHLWVKPEKKTGPTW